MIWAEAIQRWMLQERLQLYYEMLEKRESLLKTIYLAMGIHNHQPVGNFDFVFEEAFQKAYLPFLQVLEKFPLIKLAQHFSGILLEWIERNHPEFMARLTRMVKKGQVEMMTGGYYEPILAVIPDHDKIGQIRKLTEYVKAKTGYEASGIWLAERVWEPQLPKPLHDAGIVYTVIDDAHFKYAGLRDHELTGYYITEHNGAALKIFPISEKLRYTIPFHPPEQTVDFLRTLASDDGQRLVVFADDGEKFGIWPKTYEHCYEYGWIEKFFNLLQQNRDWIRIITFSDAIKCLKPIGRTYLPTASYREMMEWALPAQSVIRYEDFEQWLEERGVPEENKVFLHGGFWRNFLSKYPESNNIHKRMLRASRRLEKVSQHKRTKATGMAADHVYAGQCNCAYWHGVFGGLYLPNLRYPIYHHLIRADVQMDRLEKSREELTNGWVNYEIEDFDRDGFDEVIIETDRMNLFFTPEKGGALFELDLKSKAINLLDTMTRREEGYHRKLREALTGSTTSNTEVASIHDMVLMKEENLDQYLTYDWYRRSSMIDHFLHPNVNLQGFSSAQYGEQGDFVNQPFEYKLTKGTNGLALTLKRDGQFWIGDRFVPIGVEKKIRINKSSEELTIQYTILNMDDREAVLRFGSEWAFSLMAGDAPDRYYQSPEIDIGDKKLASRGSLADIKELSLVDEWLGLKVSLCVDKKATFWRFPIETVSMSEAGFERIYQCSVVMPHWKIELLPGRKWRTAMCIKFESL